MASATGRAQGAVEASVFQLRFDQAALRALFESPSGPVAKALQRKALQIERRAKHLCPVDTGRLRASITNRMSSDAAGLFAEIGTSVDYALFVEFGTVHMGAQPFLRPALFAASGSLL